MTIYTRVGGAPTEPSPSVMIQRWQAYDAFSNTPDPGATNRIIMAFDTKRSRTHFLGSIADRAYSVGKARYDNWHESFTDACTAVSNVRCYQGTTSWRLTIGGSTSPTLETGLTLNHLYGFPFIPGSAVKGLLHHVAEIGMMEDETAVPTPPSHLDSSGPSTELAQAVASARLIRTVFGSLSVERGEQQIGTGHHPCGPEAPMERFRGWKKRIEEANRQEDETWKAMHAALTLLTGDRHTGGMLTCFDAVPSQKSGRSKLLEVDILNPHFPNGPRDDQNPTPTNFLAVRAGATFEFRLRLAPLPHSTPEDKAEEERIEDLAGESLQELWTFVEELLRTGLMEWGIGAKTAAGYGYFDTVVLCSSERDGMQLKTTPQDPTAATQEEVPANPERAAANYLPKDLRAGELAARIDRAAGLSPAVQLAVARRTQIYYSDEVAKWRKKAAAKPAVAARLQWLEGALALGGAE